MNAHSVAAPPSASPPVKGRPHRRQRPRPSLTATLRAPLALGLFLGLYAGALHRNQGATPGEATVLGVISMAVTVAVCAVVVRTRSRLIPELRAVLYGAPFGCAIGYLHSLSGADHLSSAGMGLGWGAAMGLASFYFFHVRD